MGAGPISPEAVAGPDDAPPAAEVEARRSRVPAWLQRRWPYLLVAAIAILGNALHVGSYQHLSQIDESRHLDYIIQLYDHGHLLQLGDKLGQEVLELEACRGIDLPDWPKPRCGLRHYDPVDFRDDGFNNAANHPPGYYAITGAFTKLATATGLAGNPLDAARVVGGFWLAGGLMLLVFAGELLKLRRGSVVAAVVLFALIPDSLTFASLVNPDAASLFAGALILVAALLWERGRLHVRWLAVAAAFVALLKMTTVFVILVVAAWLLTQAYRLRKRSDDLDDEERLGPDARSYAITAAALVGGWLVVTVAWLGIAGLLATVEALRLPSNRAFYTPNPPVKALVLPQNLFSFFPPIGTYRPVLVLNKPMAVDLTMITGWLAIAAGIGSMFRFTLRDRMSVLGTWLLVVVLAGAPLFLLGTWVVNSVIFLPPSRYALSTVPVFALVVASMLRSRASQLAVQTAAALAAVIVLGSMILGDELTGI